jgi:hypothetical protein
MKHNTRSKDFRYIYTNGLQLQIGTGDVTILFGIKEDQSDPEDKILEEVGVVMTLLSAKLLAYTLSKLLEQVEKTSGSPIPLDPAKIVALETFLSAANKSA